MEKKFLWLGDFFQTVSSTTSSLRLVYYCLYGFIIIISNPFGCERERVSGCCASRSGQLHQALNRATRGTSLRISAATILHRLLPPHRYPPKWILSININAALYWSIHQVEEFPLIVFDSLSATQLQRVFFSFTIYKNKSIFCHLLHTIIARPSPKGAMFLYLVSFTFLYHR